MLKKRVQFRLTLAIASLCVAMVSLSPAEESDSNIPASPTWMAGSITPVSAELYPAVQHACSSCESGGANCQCDSNSGCNESCALCSCIAPSDTCFSDFISPITNPLFFEDPRTLTEVRPIFASHWIPDSNPVFQGGDVQYFAVQARIALTERLSIIATKDGFIWMNSDNEAVVPDDEGWADVAAGLKYNLIRDPASQFLLSGGLTFELDAGEHQVFQGSGDGEFNLFLTGGKQIGESSHWVSATGYRLPTDSSARSQMWYWSNHLDCEVRESWYALIEANWFHWTKSGDALPVNFEGGDLFNLGSTDVAGNDIVTLGVGGRKTFGKMNELGVGYEFPITDRRDLLRSRLYFDLIVRY